MIRPIGWLAGKHQPTWPTGMGVGSRADNGVRCCMTMVILSLDFLAVFLVLSGGSHYGVVVSLLALILWWMHRNTYRREVR